MFRPILPVLFVALAVSGCARGPKLVATSDLTVVNDSGLPAPTPADVAGPGRVAYVGPLDVLDIQTFGVEDLTREITVDNAGILTFPLVGRIDVNGKTASEVARAIEAGLRGRYVRRPEVNVSVKEQVSQVVTVDGSVTRPGQYPVTNNSTLMRAVALGGGLSEFAKIDDVVILRTVNNRRMAGLYNLAAIRRGTYADPAIYPNDVVVVGDSPSRRLFRDVLSVAPLAVAPLVAVLSRN